MCFRQNSNPQIIHSTCSRFVKTVFSKFKRNPCYINKIPCVSHYDTPTKMSMLAERKQKQRWSLNPRGKIWSEDSNKLGQKLMEKMGWKHGKGLGANEDGNTEHVKVSYKNDSKGMGYKESTEQWTEHDDNFTGLLKNLNGDSNDTDNNKIKLNSIHEIAETTKTRINYHKYTKGKDLSRYSEKDLANIFGKKSLTAKAEAAPIAEEKPSVIIESDNLVERGSMTDYFKKKLPNFGKNAFGLKIGSNGVLTKDDSETDERPAFGFGFKEVEERPKGKKRKYEETGIVAEPAIEELPKVKKSKKKKKTAESFVSYLNNVGNTDEPVKLEDKDIAEEPVKEKKKKSKDVLTEVSIETVEEDSPKSKRKSKKSKQNEETNETQNNQNAEETETPKKKKSKKNKVNEDVECNKNLEETPVENRKKSKTNKLNEDDSQNCTQTPNSEKKKKKKRSKKQPTVEENQEVDETQVHGFSNEAFDPTFKSPQKPEAGITNPAFDPLYNKITVEKHSLNPIEETNEDYVPEEPIQEKHDTEQPQAKTKKKKKRKNKKNLESKPKEEGGISNPCFDDKPAPEIECDLMLNVHTAPAQPKRRKNVRFSNVNDQRIIPNNTMRERNELFDINTEVIERGIQDDATNKGFVNNGFDIRSIDDVSFYEETPNTSADGTDNAGFDRRAANLEEKVKTMSKTIENCEAEVDNDINEGRVVGRRGFSGNRGGGGGYRGSRPFMRPYGRGGYGDRMQDALNIRVGEVGEPAENHYPVPGGVRLSFRDVKFSSKIPPWARRPCGNLSKQGYKHLIKGDIILNFRSANVHEVKGYAV